MLGAFLHSSLSSLSQATVEKLRMMMLALGDARVMLVVLAHHLAQARNAGQMPARERKEFVMSTEALYAPLANRLGVWSIKSELEDICLKVRTPCSPAIVEKQVFCPMVQVVCSGLG